MIDVTEAQLLEIRDILARVLPQARVVAFGSRTTGRAQRWSDLDLAVYAGRPLTLRERRVLREAFEDSTLPFHVDVLDGERLPETLARAVAEGTEVEPGAPVPR